MDTVLVLVICCLLPFSVYGSLGLIKADENGSRTPPANTQQSFCIAYNPGFQQLPASYNQQPSLLVVNITEHYGCRDADSDNVTVSGTVVAVARGNCSFVDKAAIAQKKGGLAVLVVDFDDGSTLVEPGVKNESTDYNLINITVALMHHMDFTAMMSGGTGVKVWMYAPEPPKFDPSIIIMFTMATACVVIGSLWAGNSQVKKKKPGSRSASGGKDKEEEEEEKKEEESMSLGMGILMSVCLVIFFCVSLTLLYFFYDYLVYVIIAIFSIAGVNAMFQTLLPLWKRRFTCDNRLSLPLTSKKPQIRSVFLLLFSLGFVITWLIFRHHSFAWVLQDIIGFCFCLYVMKSLILPSLRACTVLLGLLFVYDIFFVFITPYFTKNGESVMIKVATGGDSKSGEQMPTVFVLPHLMPWALYKCTEDKGSMLGFGDVIVPGLLLSYNCAFDLKTDNPVSGRRRYVYFIASAVGYLVGLVLTGVALFVMESGQPALLYLVPCTLLTTIVIAAFRKDLPHMWRGHQCPKKNDDIKPPRTSSAGDTSSSARSRDVNRNANDEEEEDNDSPNENQSLIQ